MTENETLRGDFVAYRIVLDDEAPQIFVGRSLKDIVESCYEFCEVIKSAQYIMDVHFITEKAEKYMRDAKD